MKNAHAPEPRPSFAERTEDYGAFGADFRFGPVEETRDAGLRQLTECWRDVRGERAMPTRPELNPFALRGLLRFTQMFDVVDGGRDFRIRVMGSGLSEQSGLHLTGKCVSEIDNPQLRGRICAGLSRVCETKEAVRMYATRSALRHLFHRDLEAVCLPLGDETGVTHVLSGVIYGRRAAVA